MSEKVVVTKEKLTAIGDAIREKTETSEGLGLDEMPEVIKSIQSGGGADFTISDASYLFYRNARFDRVNEIISILKDVQNMEYMFANCTSLREESSFLNNLDTSKAMKMNYMFYECEYVKSLNLQSFDTSNVTDMSYMFCCCDDLAELNLSSFNTSKVTNMSSMFTTCLSLENIDLSNFNTSKVSNMSYMFSNTKLSTLNISNFDTSNVSNMSCMFQNSKYLTSLDLSNFNTAKTTNMSLMFDGCEKIEEIIGFSAINKAGITIRLPYGTSSKPFALKRLTFRTDLPEGTYSIRSAIDIRYCSFDREGMVEMFNSLPDITSAGVSASYKKITITGNPCLTDGTLTDDDRAIATNKGWTLVE